MGQATTESWPEGKGAQRSTLKRAPGSSIARRRSVFPSEPRRCPPRTRAGSEQGQSQGPAAGWRSATSLGGVDTEPSAGVQDPSAATGAGRRAAESAGGSSARNVGGDGGAGDTTHPILELLEERAHRDRRMRLALDVYVTILEAKGVDRPGTGILVIHKGRRHCMRCTVSRLSLKLCGAPTA